MKGLTIFLLALSLAACSKAPPPPPNPPVPDDPQPIPGPPTATPNDPLFKDQWNFRAIDIPAAWQKETGCSHPVKIALFGDGLAKHKDLPRILAGYDFIHDAKISGDGDGRDNDPIDSFHDGSNTFHAGIIAGGTNNSIGIAGINQCAEIVPVRVLGLDVYTQDLIDGILWSIGETMPGIPNNPNPVNLIDVNFNIISDTCEKELQEAIDKAISKNVPIVTSVGNSGIPAKKREPANCQNVIAVGSTDDQNYMLSDSNYGPGIFLAPGGDIFRNSQIISTAEGAGSSYEKRSGTGIATPHVVGVVSLMLAQNPALTPAQIKQKLIDSATLPKNCVDDKCGYGLINAAKALN